MKLKHKLKLLVIGFSSSSILMLNSTVFAITPATPPSGSTVDQRIALRKKEQNITLDSKVQDRLVKQCKGAQSKIAAIVHDMDPVINTRNETYQKVDAKLWVLIGQVKLAKKDTFQFEQQHSEYVKKISDFQTTGTNFRQTLDDLVVINCAGDIIGFKALLETARTYYTQMYNQSADANNYLVNNVKTTIDGFTSQLTTKTNPDQ